MAQINEVKIAGLEGNFQAQPRVFAHSAKALTIPTGVGKYVDVFNVASDAAPVVPGEGDNTVVLSRGACLYVGTQGDVVVLLEGDSTMDKTTGVVTDVPVKFVGVPAGSFLPIQALRVYSDTDGTTADDIVALF